MVLEDLIGFKNLSPNQIIHSFSRLSECDLVSHQEHVDITLEGLPQDYSFCYVNRNLSLFQLKKWNHLY